MNVAEEKKQNNISEYIIHMYQTEDLIRAFDFDMELIKQYVLKHIPGDQDQQASLTKWYGDILDAMKSEDIVQQGHLSSIQKYVDELSDLKDKLLEEDEDFIKAYNNAKSHIDEMIGLSNGMITSEVQICLNGIYGLLLARIQGREVPEDIMKSIETFGDVLSYLSFKYNQRDFMKEN
ncbi:MAG: DUF4924 family protein [Bacteroidota bacterium]